MKKTRIISLLVILVMVLSLFTACGETPAEPTKAPETQTPATQAPDGGEETPETPDEPEIGVGKVQLPICDEVVDLSLFFLWDQGMAGNYVSSAADFEGYLWLEDQTHVHIDFIEVASNAFSNQFNITIASGEYPDLLMRVARTYSAGVQNAIEEEVIMDVTDLLDEYAPNYKAALEANETLRKVLYTDQGRMGVFYPLFTKMAPGPTEGLAIRQDWLDRLNLDVPETYDDYEEVMQAFMTEIDSVEFGTMMGMYGLLSTNAIVSGFGINAVADATTKPFYVVDGEVKMGRVGPEYKEYLTLMREWYQKGFITPDFISWTGINSFSKNPLYAPSITTGQVAIFNVNSSSFKLYPDMCDEEGAKFTALTEPVKNEGDKILVGKAANTAMYEKTGVAITTQCEEWEVAMKWLDWFYTEEGAIFNLYGVQGKTWDYDENGEVWWTDLYLNPPEGVTTSNLLYKYAGGTITWGYSLKNDMDYKFYQKYGDPAYGARLTWGSKYTYERTYPDGAVFNAEEGDIWSKYNGDFGTYIMEVTPMFLTGEMSLDEYEAYEKMVLEDLHGNELIKIAQQAYDRYMSK